MHVLRPLRVFFISQKGEDYMSSYNIYQTLCDVVKKAYPIEEYPNNAFTKFFVDSSLKR